MDDDTVLEFRPPTDEDLDSILDVLEVAFDDWPGLGPEIDPLEYLDWKCHSSPASIGHHIVARDGDNIVGVIIRTDRRIKVLDDILPGQSGGDSSLIPQLQGRGLFSQLRRNGIDHACSRGVALQLSFPGHPATFRTWVTTGLAIRWNKWAMLLKPLDAKRTAGRVEGFASSLPLVVTAAGILFMALASRLRHGRSRPPTDDGSVETVEEFDESVNDLWKSAAQDFDFIPVRDRAFLNWRYCDRRAGRFIVRVQKDGSQLAGYCVLKFVGGRAYIADLLARSGRLDVIERLAWDADRLAREQGADAIVCQLPSGHPYEKTLLRAGFLNTRRGANFGVVPLSIDSRKLDFLTKRGAKIHVTHGDSDLI